MSKQEFVDRLRVSLSGKISPASVEDNARYYEDYINTHIRLGEPEEDVLEGLGDPRLIARSIVAAESVKTGRGSGVWRKGRGDRPRRKIPAGFPHIQPALLGIACAGRRDTARRAGAFGAGVPAGAAYAGLAVAGDCHCHDSAFFYKIIWGLAALTTFPEGKMKKKGQSIISLRKKIHMNILEKYRTYYSCN